MNRLLAITLALLVVSPNCWCCLMKKETPKPVVHDCCKLVADAGKDCPLDGGKSKPAKGDDSCGCDLSKTKRETSLTVVALPEPPATFELLSFDFLHVLAAAGDAPRPRLKDEGLLRRCCALYVSNCALRL